MKQPRSFAQREDAGKKKVTKGGAISRRIERSEIDCSKSSPKGVEWQSAAKRGQVRSRAEGMIRELALRLERVKAQVRARVEHPFPVLKNIFRHRKTPDRGLAKNPAQLHRLFALANLFLARRTLLNPARA